MKRILISLTAFVVSGCTTFEPPFQSASVHYNRVIADTNNELVLLNIIRAKEREPMYFTAVAQMRGSLTLSGTTGLSADFPEDGFSATEAYADSTSVANRTISTLSETATKSVRTLKPSVSATIATNPSFDYQVLDTQKFYNGIMASIQPSLLASYLRQGWRDNLLTALTVEKVEFFEVTEEVTKDGKPIPDILLATLENDPVGEADKSFGDFIECFETQPVSKEPTKSILFNLAQVKEPSLAGLPVLGKNGYSIDGKGNVVYSVSKPDTLNIVPRTSPPTPACHDFLLAIGLSEGLIQEAFNEKAKDAPKDKRLEARLAEKSGQPVSVRNGLAINYTMRSTQSVLYFLGEYLRKQEDDSNVVYKIGGNGTAKEKVFEVVTSQPTKAFAKTELNGQSYWIESMDSQTKNNTLSSMAFLNQMINLQKSADERPTTETVQSVR